MNGHFNSRPWFKCIQRTRMQSIDSTWGQASRKLRRALISNPRKNQCHAQQNNNSIRVKMQRQWRLWLFTMNLNLITLSMTITISWAAHHRFKLEEAQWHPVGQELETKSFKLIMHIKSLHQRNITLNLFKMDMKLKTSKVKRVYSGTTLAEELLCLRF